MNIFTLLTAAFCVYIAKCKDENKQIAFLLGLIFLPASAPVILFPVPTTPYRFLVLTLIIVTVYKYGVKGCLKLPFFKISAFIYFCLFTVTVLDGRSGLSTLIFRPIMTWIDGFAVLPFLFAWPLPARFRNLSTPFFYAVFALIAYAIVVYAIKNNPYTVWVSATTGAPDFFSRYLSYDERFRTSSFFMHPMIYGYFSTLSICVVMVFYEQYTVRTRVLFLHFMIGLAAVILSNSRLPIATYILCCFSFIITSRRIPTISKSGIIAVSLLTIPVLNSSTDILSKAFSIFGTSSSVSGSSIDMRMTQLFATLDVAAKHPIRGNGLNYVVDFIAVPLDEIGTAAQDTDFANFESIVFILVIEQGLIGILWLGALIASIFWYIFSNKRPCYIPVALLAISYLIFIFGSGPLMTQPIFCSLFAIACIFSMNRNIPQEAA